jgi:1,4-dihydroxy-2-naphthoate polyprenyltransferase
VGSVDWRLWVRASRPHSFTASLVPLLVGGACAALEGAFAPRMFALAMAASVALQAGTNLVNDYFDWRSGADAVGPSGRILREGLLGPTQVRNVGLAALALGCGGGLVIVAQVGWPILILGLIGVPLAYGYTAPPIKLAYRGFGEAVVFLLMGPCMVIGGYLIHGARRGLGTPLVASIPVGCLVAGILQVNNIRDIELDRASGKLTLATRLGGAGARREFDVLLAGAYLGLPGAVALRRLPWPALLAMVSLPVALRLRTMLNAMDEPDLLAPAVPRAAALQFRFGLLLASGILLGAVVRRWRQLKW